MSRILLATLMLGCLLAPTTSLLAQFPPSNYIVTPSFPGLQNEEQIFLCPDDTNRVLINHRDFRLGYRQIGLGHGVDAVGGSVVWTWEDTLIHTDYQVYNRQSDPVMTVNSSGDLIICHLDYQTSSDSDTSHIAFMVSSDCGDTWNGPYTVSDTIGPYFEDKQFIACDRTGGPYDGNIYVGWARFTNTINIKFARSTTNATTWDDIVTVGPATYVSCLGGTLYAGQFTQPLVGKDGAVYVFWQGWDVDSLGGDCDLYTAIQYNKSTDGGVTWEGARTLNHVDGWSSVDGGVDVYSQPTTAADITNGPHAGNLYLQYRDTSGRAFNDSDIMFRRSLDTGQTWSEPVRVNDDPVGPDIDQFHNWLMCNDDGILVSIWYDQRDDATGQSFHVYAGYSFDGGSSWTSNHRISQDPIVAGALLSQLAAGETRPAHGPLDEQTPQASRAGLIAEYIGVDCVSDKVVATWTGTPLGPVGGTAQDVVFAGWHLTPMPPRLIAPIDGDTAWADDDVDFSWATSWKEDRDSYNLEIASDPSFSDIVRDVNVSEPSHAGALADLYEGMFYWRVTVTDQLGPGAAVSPVDSFFLTLPSECFCFNQADLNDDSFFDAVDLSLLIEILFFNGTDIQDMACPITRSDLNCDGVADAVDLNLLIELLFFNGPSPCNPCFT
ncbi:MAG: hypothetical protein GF341_12570 [candidate division Zixibacteria bacterium]|nr:hypothetical protein [candidate division Zixibacteria bacterium]